MSYIMKHKANIDLNFQIGGKTIIGERLENFSKKYGLFTKTFNIAKKELTELGHTRKLSMISKSSFGAYANTKGFNPKFGFKNLDSDKQNIIDEIKPLIQSLQSGNSTKKVLVMPLFVRSKNGLTTDSLFINITHKQDNMFSIVIDKVSAFSESDKTSVDEKLVKFVESIGDHFLVELHDDSFQVEVSMNKYDFDDITVMDLGIDMIHQNLLYTLYFVYKRLLRMTTDLQTVFDETMSYSNNTDFVSFLKKTNFLVELGIKEQGLIERLNQNIVQQLKKRPDKDSKKLMTNLENTFENMKQLYDDFDTETINIEELTEGIELKTKELVDLFEQKNKEYEELAKTRILINSDIDKIYSEFMQLKDAIVYGMDNLIEHRGIINKQLKKFEKLQQNSKYYEQHKDVFEKIKTDLNNMLQTQNEFDTKIYELKNKLDYKKKELKEKNIEIQKIDRDTKDTQNALKIIQKKLRKFKQEGGNKNNIKRIIEIARKRNNNKQLSSIKTILKHSYKLNNEVNELFQDNIGQKGGKVGRPPSKSKLDKAIIGLSKQTNELKGKKNIKTITQEFLPVIKKYQEYIRSYHKQMNDREILKDALRKSYQELRKHERSMKLATNEFKSQDTNLEKIIKKIDVAKLEMEDNVKGRATIDKLEEHKKQLIKYINSRGDYNNKVQKINKALTSKKQSLDSTKNEISHKLSELKKTGQNLDEIKRELEEKTAMYGGSTLNQIITSNYLKQDKYLRYLSNPIEFVLKGGKNNLTITNKNMNNWINEQPQYIFKNFTKKELLNIATNKLNLRLVQNKNRNQLVDTIKFVLYGGTGMVKKHEHYSILAALLKVNLLDLDQNNKEEVKRRVNLKLSKIDLPFINKIQTGGVKIQDEYRFKEKYVNSAKKDNLFIKINLTKKQFESKIQKLLSPQGSMKAQVIKTIINVIQKNNGKISLMKNNKLDSSYDSVNLTLEHLSPVLLSYLISQGVLNDKVETYIDGDYLNETKIIDQTNQKNPNNYYKLPFNNSSKDLPSLKSLIITAFESNNAGVIVEGTDLIALLNVNDKTESKFQRIIEKTAKQLANVQSIHLNTYTDTAKNVFVDNNSPLTSWKAQVIYSNILRMNEIVEKLFLPPKADHKDFLLLVSIKPKSDTARKYKLKGRNALKVKGIRVKQIGSTDYPHWICDGDIYDIKKKVSVNDPIDIPISAIKVQQFVINVFTEDPKLKDIMQENKQRNQSGGSAFKVDNKFVNSFVHTDAIIPKKTKSKKSSVRKLPSFISRGDQLMDQYELSETLKYLGDKLIEIGKDKTLRKAEKNKIAVFNVIQDDENNQIDKTSLYHYLDDVLEFLEGYRPSKTTEEMTKIVENIKEFYKGTEFSGVIKSKKQILYEHIRQLSKYGRHLPPLQKEISRFIKTFNELQEKYEKEYFAMQDRETREIKKISNPSKRLTKSSELKKFIDKIKNLVYTGEEDNRIFNFENFPVDNLGKSNIKIFVHQIENIYEQALQDENDILAIDKMIDRLEILYLIMDSWITEGLKWIPDEIDLDDFANATEARSIIKKFSESFKDEDIIAEEKPVDDHIVDMINTNRDKYFAHVHPLKKNKDPSNWGAAAAPPAPPVDSVVETEKKIKKRTKGDGERWLKKLSDMINKLKDVKELLISKLYEAEPLDMGDIKDLGVIDINKFLRRQIILIEEDYRNINNQVAQNKRLNKNSRVKDRTEAESNYKMTSKIFDDKMKRDNVRLRIDNKDASDYHKQAAQADKDHWKDKIQWDNKKPVRNLDTIKVIRKAEANSKGENPQEVKSTTVNEFTVITDWENDLKFFDRTLGEFIRGGRAMLNSIQRAGTISDIATSLQKKIDSIKIKEKDVKVKDRANQNLLKFQESTALEMRDILTDKNTFSILSKELPISIIDKRQKQLKLLTSIKNDVSRLLSGGAGDGEMNEIQNLSELVKDDDMGIPEDEDISEAIYDIIKRRNHQFNLPRYSIISDLELVNFMGWVHKFKSEMWDEDENYHGDFNVYINEICKGILFTPIARTQLAKFDTGDLTNVKWLSTFYTHMMNFITQNQITTFSKFLEISYKSIVTDNAFTQDIQNDNYPKNSGQQFHYDKWWDEAMEKIGDNWQEKKVNAELTGLKEFWDLTGDGKGFVLSKFEKTLLFSFIIHAKSLIQDDENPISSSISKTVRQKYNKFKELLPKDTAYLMVVAPEMLDKTTKQGIQHGGRDTSDMINDIISPTNNDHSPGSFLLHKNLDGIRELYIYDETCKRKVLEERPDLARKLHIPSDTSFVDYRNLGIGASEDDGLNQLARIPRVHKDTIELRKCAKYRLLNTGEKPNPDWTVWELEKLYTGRKGINKFKSILLWTIEDLNRLEKAIICVDHDDKFIDGFKSREKALEAQKLKYRAFNILIESSSADYPDFEDGETTILKDKDKGKASGYAESPDAKEDAEDVKDDDKSNKDDDKSNKDDGKSNKKPTDAELDREEADRKARIDNDIDKLVEEYKAMLNTYHEYGDHYALMLFRKAYDIIPVIWKNGEIPKDKDGKLLQQYGGYLEYPTVARKFGNRYRDVEDKSKDYILLFQVNLHYQQMYFRTDANTHVSAVKNGNNVQDQILNNKKPSQPNTAPTQRDKSKPNLFIYSASRIIQDNPELETWLRTHGGDLNIPADRFTAFERGGSGNCMFYALRSCLLELDRNKYINLVADKEGKSIRKAIADEVTPQFIKWYLGSGEKASCRLDFTCPKGWKDKDLFGVRNRNTPLGTKTEQPNPPFSWMG